MTNVTSEDQEGKKMTRLELLQIKITTDKYQGKWLNTVDPFELMLECMSEWTKWYLEISKKSWDKFLSSLDPKKAQGGRFATVPLLKSRDSKLANSDIDI